MAIEIVEASVKCIPIIQALATCTWAATYEYILSEEQISYMMQKMYNTATLTAEMNELGHHYLLITDDNECKGYLSYELNFRKQKATKIHKIYLLPNTSRKGFGLLLMNAVEQIAKDNRNNELTLNVNRENKALGFYERIGFDIIGEEDVDIGNNFVMQDYILTKKLVN